MQDPQSKTPLLLHPGDKLWCPFCNTQCQPSERNMLFVFCGSCFRPGEWARIHTSTHIHTHTQTHTQTQHTQHSEHTHHTHAHTHTHTSTHRRHTHTHTHTTRPVHSGNERACFCCRCSKKLLLPGVFVLKDMSVGLQSTRSQPGPAAAGPLGRTTGCRPGDRLRSTRSIRRRSTSPRRWSAASTANATPQQVDQQYM